MALMALTVFFNNIIFCDYLAKELNSSFSSPVDYLMIAPWEDGVKRGIEEISVPHWDPLFGKSNPRSLEMGHRGCGSTNGQNR